MSAGSKYPEADLPTERIGNPFQKIVGVRLRRGPACHRPPKCPLHSQTCHSITESMDDSFGSIAALVVANV